MSGKEPLKCKIVLIGEKGVGKTSIIDRYVRNNFRLELLSTAGLCYTEKTVLIKDYNQSIKFEIFDTAGEERFRSIVKLYYGKSDVCIFTYDTTNRVLFEKIKNYWIKEMKASSSSTPSN